MRPLARLGLSGDQAVTDIAFSTAGPFMAAVTCDQAIALWETERDLPLPVPPIENPAPCQGSWKLAFSPAGLLLASTSNAPDSRNVVELWTVSSNFGAQPLQSLPAGPRPVNSLAFSPDGRILAAGTQENNVRLWFISDPRDPLATPITELGLLSLSDWAVDVSFSPDGRWLAAGTAERQDERFIPAVYLWRVQDLLKAGAGRASVFTALEARSGPLRQVRFSQDGRLLAAAGEGLTLWEAEGEPVEAGQENEGSNTIRWIERAFLEIPAGVFDFSPDGTLLAAGGQGLQIWDLTGGMPSEDEDSQAWMSPDPLDGEILSLAFAPSGQALATLSAEGMVTFWAVPP